MSKRFQFPWKLTDKEWWICSIEHSLNTYWECVGELTSVHITCWSSQFQTTARVNTKKKQKIATMRDREAKKNCWRINKFRSLYQWFELYISSMVISWKLSAKRNFRRIYRIDRPMMVFRKNCFCIDAHHHPCCPNKFDFRYWAQRQTKKPNKAK